MVIVITDNCVTDVEQYLPLAKAFAAAASQDKGCHGMKVYRDSMAEGRVVYISRWDSKDDFMNHIEGATFQKHIPAMSAYYVSGKDSFLEEVE